MEYRLNIVHLYPDILNLYGDKGNIACLSKRLLWRDIGVNVIKHTKEEEALDFDNADIILLGGGTDCDMEIVLGRLLKIKNELRAFVENGGSLIALCGGYELLGRCLKTTKGETEGLGILDIYADMTKNENRLIGDVIIENDELGKIVGFENHGGRIEIGDYSPLGRVTSGFGNNEEREFEGVVYKNLIGTYLHGPLLPKNPKLCDKMLENALKHKYSDFSHLSPLDDTLENAANEYIVSMFSK